MSTTKEEVREVAKAEVHSPWPHVRLAETDRLETFSDNVLSITITLLVAEIVRPEHAPGQLLEKLTAQWASYIAFLASFCYTGVIWLNHRAVFARVRYCDRSLHLANLFLGGGDPLCRHRRGHVPVMARCVSRSEHTSVPSGGRCKFGLLPEGALPRLARCHFVCHRRPGGMAIDAEACFARLPGIADLLWHHQRGFDGNTNSSAVWKGPSRSYGEERSSSEEPSRGSPR